MKKTQWKYLFKMIKMGRVSFGATILFVGLGLALYCGMSWTCLAIYGYADEIYENANVHHFDIAFPHGISEAKLEEFLTLDEIDSVEGYHSSYEYLNLKGNQIQALVLGLTEEIDKPMDVKGQLPQKSNEIAVEGFWAKKNDIEIGDEISFLDKSVGTAGIPVLSERNFVVTALMETGVYMSTNEDSYGIVPSTEVPVGCVMFVGKNAINPLLISTYTQVAVRCEALSGVSTFSDEYKETETLLKDTISEKAEELSDGKSCVVSTREQLMSYHVTTGMVNTFGRSKLAVASVFAVVGLLVCYSSLSRSVHAQTTQIGIMKTMGFRKREILRLYLSYAAIIVAAGCISGVLLAMFFVQPAILGVIKGSYVFQDFKVYFDWREAFVLSLIEASFIVFVAWSSVRTVLHRPAVELLAGAQNRSGKARVYEKFTFYHRLPIFTKIIIKNCFHDVRRIIGMVIGVMGCTALVVIPFIYKNLTVRNYEMQYAKSYFFDYMIHYDGKSDETAQEKIRTLLEKENVSYANILYSNLYLREPEGAVSFAVLFVPSDVNSYKKLVRPVADNGDRDTVYKGTWVSRAFCEEYELDDVASLEYTTISGETKQIETTGYVNYYLNNVQIYMDSDTYQENFGEKIEYNTFIFDSKGQDMKDLSEKLLQVDGFVSMRNYASSSKAMFDVIISVSMAIVGVYVTLAFAMAVLVLLNLQILYVDEKKRELIIMRVNGYSLKDAKRYIYMDTIVITMIGIVLGVLLGEIVGNMGMSAFETNTLFYPFAFDVWAAVIGAVVSACLSFVMSQIAMRRIGKFQLADLNK